MARILLVDDDPALLEVLGIAVTDAGHELLTAPDGAAAIATIGSSHPDLVVSDVNMPRLDGFSLCRRVREAGLAIPIVLLTSRDGEIDEALGLELGADDFVSKPFSTRVLMARIASLLRREAMRASATAPAASAPTAAAASAASTVTAGDLVLDLDRLAAHFRGTAMVVTVSEFRLLEALARRPGVVLSREQLLERMRGDDSVVADRIIDTYVRRLRRKLEAIDAAFDGIETVVGAGYRWRA
jgi:DNA-binding response OmpR family regulator